MPSLDEVLARFPDKRFLINIKSNDLSEGEKLAAYLAKLAPEARARLMVYGGTPPTELVHEKLPDVAIGSKNRCRAVYWATPRSAGRATCPPRAARA